MCAYTDACSSANRVCSSATLSFSSVTTSGRLSPPSAKKDPKAAYVAIPVNLSVQGTMPQLLGFLRQLESGTHYCRVLTFSLAGSPDRKSPLSLSINLELLGLP